MGYEDDLQKMISNVQFRRVNNDFIISIQSPKKVFVFANKTKHLQYGKSHYAKLLTDSNKNI